MTPLERLLSRWRSDADVLEEHGAIDRASGLRKAAKDVESALEETELESLTIEQAVEEGGYTYSAIEKGLRNGELPNVGKRGSPRIRRGDIPRKGGRMSHAHGIADEIIASRVGTRLQ
jgi:hypothetical protein